MKKYLVLLGTICIIASTGYAQTDISKPIVQHAVYFDVSPALRDMLKVAPEKADNSWKNGIVRNYFNSRKNAKKKKFPSDWSDPLIQHTPMKTATGDSTIQNFAGNSNTQGYDPPDTYGDVGPNDYFGLVNCHFTIYSKTGTVLLGPTNTSNLWTGMPNNSNDGDAVVMYDEVADRWLVSQFSFPNDPNAPFYQMIAVSQTPDPTGSWYRYEYSFADMNDYPKFGVWPDGYYYTCNRFASGSGNYNGTGQAAFNRTKMIAGDASAEMVYFTINASNNAWGLLPADCDGPFPPLGTPNYFVYYMDGPDYLGVYEFHVDWTNTANSTFGNYLQLPVATFNDNITLIAQKGTTRGADALADRLMYRLQFREFSDHWSMVCNHTVNIGSNIAGIRWYELRKGTGPWSIYQQSTYSLPDSNSRWLGSVALDTAGNIGLGFSISGSKMYPAIKYTGRLKNDVLNTMDIPEKGIFYGTASNSVNDGGGMCRWGDYSSLTIDPSDGMTFWYTQQYFTSMGSNWRTRIASFTFSNIFNVTALATPGTICIGDSTQLNATVSGGSGTYTYSWTSVPAGFTSTIKNPVAKPVITTKFFVAVNDGNTTTKDSIMVTVNGKPTANAGPNASYPNTTPSFPLTGTAANYSSVKWLTAGDGSFNTDTALNCVYNTGTNDAHNGGVLLTLQANAISPCSIPATDTVFITLNFPVGVVTDATAVFDVNILPNPTAGIFNLLVHGIKDMEVSVLITDIEGKTVFSDQDRPPAKEYSKVINLTGLPKGVYLIKVQSGAQLITKKLVIQ